MTATSPTTTLNSKFAVFEFTVTSDGSGDASVTVGPVAGAIWQVETKPVASSEPTANWDYVLNNSQGADLMGGAGANRNASNNNPQITVPTTDDSKPPACFGSMTFVGSNMGATKSVDVRVIVKQV